MLNFIKKQSIQHVDMFTVNNSHSLNYIHPDRLNYSESPFRYSYVPRFVMKYFNRQRWPNFSPNSSHLGIHVPYDTRANSISFGYIPIKTLNINLA